MKNKGMTLVELLASIILLGIIVAIAIPCYNVYIEKGKKKAFTNTLQGITRSIELYVSDNPDTSFDDPINIADINLDAENISTIKSGSFYIEDGTIHLVNISNGDFCGNGIKGEYEVIKGKCS